MDIANLYLEAWARVVCVIALSKNPIVSLAMFHQSIVPHWSEVTSKQVQQVGSSCRYTQGSLHPALTLQLEGDR